MRAELELAEADGEAAPAERILGDLREALGFLDDVESAVFKVARVLVLDDDQRLAELTARGLRRMGYEAEPGGAFRQLRPNEIVVFDLSLAESLDAGARGALRKAHPIVVTGATDPGSRALAEELDASDYLVKPVELEALAAAINRRTGGGR